MADTKIEWTDATWGPTIGCSRVSEGCRHCYAEVMAARIANAAQAALRDGRALTARQGAYRLVVRWKEGGTDPAGMHDVAQPRWNGRVVLDEEALSLPLRWRKPRRIFVNSMSDLFHEALSEDAIRAVFATMARAPQHTFQILTKRPERMRDILTAWQRDGLTLREGCGAKLPNVWLGVSVEDQERADERIPLLLETPAAVRFLSCEPLIGPLDLDRPRCDSCGEEADSTADDEATPWCSEDDEECIFGHWLDDLNGGINWVIVGGESGPGARPCDVGWIRSIVAQCKAAGVACFVKQLGARPHVDISRDRNDWPSATTFSEVDGPRGHVLSADLRDRKGGTMEEWPEDLRVREFPRPSVEPSR